MCIWCYIKVSIWPSAKWWSPWWQPLRNSFLLTPERTYPCSNCLTNPHPLVLINYVLSKLCPWGGMGVMWRPTQEYNKDSHCINLLHPIVVFVKGVMLYLRKSAHVAYGYACRSATRSGRLRVGLPPALAQQQCVRCLAQRLKIVAHTIITLYACSKIHQAYRPKHTYRAHFWWGPCVIRFSSNWAPK